MKALACLAVLALAACGTTTPAAARHSPTASQAAVSPSQGLETPSAGATASPTASPTAGPTVIPPPVPASGTYGVLVTQPAGGIYSVSIVANTGRLMAHGEQSALPQPTCGGAAAAVVPYPVSTSNNAVYAEDSYGHITRISLDAGALTVTTVPAASASRRSMFAVSPDDKRIAVVVDDFTSTGANTSLYVENLDGTGRADIFSESGAYTIWPVGWHGQSLVVAKAPACTQGGGPLCCGPQEFHVVNPASGVRLATIGGSGCTIAGPPSLAGVLCENTGIDFIVYDWSNALKVQEPSGLSSQSAAFLSPNGQHIAVSDGTTTRLAYENGTYQLVACGWIDDNHLLAGGNAQTQPRIATVPGGQITPVATQGDCAGRIPGGL